MHKEPILGVIGGMGPYAGLDLVRKIFDQTQAGTDQEHLPVAVLSYSNRILDRSAYLFGEVDENPAHAIAAIAADLDRLGATVAGLPCNSAHASAIFDTVKTLLRDAGHPIRLLHMIEEAARYARETVRGIERIGALSTLALYKTNLYPQTLTEAGFTAIVPDEDVQRTLINPAIFDPTYGIKAHSNPVTETARQHVLQGIRHLRDKGAEAVILGCTELPLAVAAPFFEDVLLIDPTAALARALIRETYPEKLSPTLEPALASLNGRG